MLGQNIDPMDKIWAGSEAQGEECTSFRSLRNRRIGIELRTKSDPTSNAVISRNPSDRPLHPLDLLRKTCFFCGERVQYPDGYPSLVAHVEIAQSQPCRRAEAWERRLMSIAARNDLENQIAFPIPQPEHREKGVMDQSISA